MDKHELHCERCRKVVEAGMAGARKSLEGQNEVLRKVEDRSRTFLAKAVDKR